MLQYSDTLVNAQLDQIEVVLGPSAQCIIRSGPPPASTAGADTGTTLATVLLPLDWMSPAANRIKVKAGTWQDLTADGTGIAGHFRMKDQAGAACHIQGTVGAIGSGAEIEVDNVNFNAGQAFTINTFQVTAGNA